MKKKYYIAQIDKITINETEMIVFKQISLPRHSIYYNTLEDAEKALEERGKRFTEYTIIAEYYNCEV